MIYDQSGCLKNFLKYFGMWHTQYCCPLDVAPTWFWITLANCLCITFLRCMLYFRDLVLSIPLIQYVQHMCNLGALLLLFYTISILIKAFLDKKKCSFSTKLKKYIYIFCALFFYDINCFLVHDCCCTYARDLHSPVYFCASICCSSWSKLINSCQHFSIFKK